MNKNKKILVINFGGLGDEILFLPFLSSLKKTVENCSTTLVLEPRSKAIFQISDDIDNIICVDIKSKNKYLNILKFLFKVRFQYYDMVFSSGASPLVAILLFLTGIKKRFGFKTGKITDKLLTKAIPLNKNQYAGEMYHDLIRGIDEKTEFSLPHLKDFPLEKKVIEKEKSIILIHPGVSQMSIKKNIFKSLDKTKWINLIIKLVDTKKYTVVLCGGKDDEKIISEITKELSPDENFINYFGKTKNLEDFIKLVKSSDILVCTDSAPLHIGIALKTKIVTVFCPTNEKLLVPQADNIKVVKRNDLDCRPCLWHKRQTSCEERTCLDIDENKIIEAIESMV